MVIHLDIRTLKDPGGCRSKNLAIYGLITANFSGADLVYFKLLCNMLYRCPIFSLLSPYVWKNN